MRHDNPQPTALEAEQAMLAHHEIAETINRMAREGFQVPALATGLAACAADLVTCTLGVTEVPKWFAAQAIAAKTLLDGEA